MNHDRKTLLALLLDYHPSDNRDATIKTRLIEFVEKNIRCCDRTNLDAHITGSAWVVDKTKSHVLLTHHKKLSRWLQLGGHADGNRDILGVALREAQEESGLQRIQVLSPNIFDMDIHTIPARADEPQHLHYDIRFIFEADRLEPLAISAESNQLAWVPLKNLESYSMEESLLRMKRKTLLR